MSGEEKLEVTWANLFDVYLDGFASGVASGLLTVSQGRCGGEAAEHMAQHLAQGLGHDPLSRAEVENEIRERLAGIDSGSKQWWVDGRPGEQP